MPTDDFFKKKIAALLHDPPSKPWIISGNLSWPGGHENDARSLAAEIFDDEISNLINDTDVKGSDRLAASFDRWILSLLMGGDYEYQAFLTREVRLYNLFYREKPYEAPLKPPSNYLEQREEFIKNIERIHHQVLSNGGWQLAYYTFYSIYEYVWCKYFGTPGPADTRIPTHTVFDHTYATASTLNIVGNGKIDGFMVAIDLGGVQKFIAASRKLRDLWASSWLTSSLAWSIILPFVENFGPDILILPTARGNPFFYHTLLCMHKARRIWTEIDNIPNDIKKAAELAGYNIDLGYPSNAVIPGKLTLMLPSTTSHPEDAELTYDGKRLSLSDAKEIAEFVNYLYHLKWRKLVQEILDVLTATPNLEFLRQVCLDLALNESPPLPLRVAVAEIKSKPTSKENYLAYHKTFQHISHALSEAGSLKYSPSATLNLTEYTRKYEKYAPASGELRFYACSLCGEVPAIPKSLEVAEKINSSVNEKNLITVEMIRGRQAGERLCPYCLIKRLSTTRKVFPKILEVLLGKYLSPNLPRFPSVSSVAAINFKKAVIDAAIKSPENILQTLHEVIKSREDINESLFSQVVYPPEQELLKQIGQKFNKDNFQVLGTLAIGDAEDLLLVGEQRAVVSSLARAVRKVLPSESIVLNTYYALIKGDGDDVGKVVGGYIGDVKAIPSFNNLFKYLSNLTPNQVLSGVLDMIGDNRLEEAAKYLSKELNRQITPENICELLTLLQSGLKSEAEPKNKWTKIFPVSPSYHSFLSRALMTIATITSRELSRLQGFIVYSGGDDVLAVCPTDAAIDAALKVRMVYGGEPLKGFLKQSDTEQDTFVPALGDLSQSFSITYAHYRYPLSLVLKEAVDALEDEAKEVEWLDYNSTWLNKDSLVETYLPRAGNPVRSRLPFRGKNGEIGRHIKGVLDIVASIDDGLISGSFVKDLDEEMIRIGIAHSTGAKDIAEMIIGHVVDRNVKGKAGQSDKTKIKDVLLKYLGYAWCYGYEPDEQRRRKLNQRLLINELGKALQAELGAKRGVES